MAVTEEEVRHVAALARLGLDAERDPDHRGGAQRILAHMEVCPRSTRRRVAPVTGVGAAGTPLRVDGGNQIPLARPRDAFAPAMRDGFFLVPRLATHEDADAESP